MYIFFTFHYMFLLFKLTLLFMLTSKPIESMGLDARKPVFGGLGTT